MFTRGTYPFPRNAFLPLAYDSPPVATRKRKEFCKRCSRHESVCGEMSATALCADCGRARVEENIIGIHFHTGPAFERWRRGMAASVGAQFVDNAPESG